MHIYIYIHIASKVSRWEILEIRRMHHGSQKMSQTSAKGSGAGGESVATVAKESSVKAGPSFGLIDEGPLPLLSTYGVVLFEAE